MMMVVVLAVDLWVSDGRADSHGDMIFNQSTEPAQESRGR